MMYWTVHLEGGPRKVNHAAACVGDKLYSFGGYCSCEDYDDWMPIPIHVFDTNNLRWSVVKCAHTNDVPLQRYGHTVVTYNDNIYMWGGRNNKVAFNILCCYNTAENRWSIPSVEGNVPDPIDGHTACVVGDKMYIFGGFDNFTEEYSKEVFTFDFLTNVWSSVRTTNRPPPARDFHSVTVVGTKMFILGGRCSRENQEEYYPFDLYYLDTTTLQWMKQSTVGSRPRGRRSHSAWLYDGEIYIFGGYNSILDRHFNDLWKFNPSSFCWTRLKIGGKVPTKRRRQSCVLHLNKLYLFGGTTPHSDPAEDLIDNSDLHVLDYKPTLRTMCITAVLKHKLSIENLPKDILYDINAMTLPNQISRPLNASG